VRDATKMIIEEDEKNLRDEMTKKEKIVINPPYDDKDVINPVILGFISKKNVKNSSEIPQNRYFHQCFRINDTVSL
jgi:hypothetical protein